MEAYTLPQHCTKFHLQKLLSLGNAVNSSANVNNTGTVPKDIIYVINAADSMSSYGFCDFLLLLRVYTWSSDIHPTGCQDSRKRKPKARTQESSCQTTEMDRYYFTHPMDIIDHMTG